MLSMQIKGNLILLQCFPCKSKETLYYYNAFHANQRKPYITTMLSMQIKGNLILLQCFPCKSKETLYYYNAFHANQREPYINHNAFHALLETMNFFCRFRE